MDKRWDLDDITKYWEIEQQLKKMLNGEKIFYYNGVFEGIIKEIEINYDGSADVSMYGSNNNGPKAHYNLHLRLFEDAKFEIVNCHIKA